MKQLLRITAAAAVTAFAIAGTTPAASARVDAGGSGVECLEVDGHGSAESARGGRELDHRAYSAAERRAVRKRTRSLLAGESGASSATATIPVYVHVMRSKSRAGDVTNTQIAQQIDVLNASFGGLNSPDAADSGFDFRLAGTFRYNNSRWHKDR